MSTANRQNLLRAPATSSGMRPSTEVVKPNTQRKASQFRLCANSTLLEFTTGNLAKGGEIEIAQHRVMNL